MVFIFSAFTDFAIHFSGLELWRRWFVLASSRLLIRCQCASTTTQSSSISGWQVADFNSFGSRRFDYLMRKLNHVWHHIIVVPQCETHLRIHTYVSRRSHDRLLALKGTTFTDFSLINTSLFLVLVSLNSIATKWLTFLDLVGFTTIRCSIHLICLCS